MIEIECVCGSCRAPLTVESADLLLLLPVDPDDDPAVDDELVADDNAEARLVHGCPECGRTTVRTVAWPLVRLLLLNGTPALPDLELQPAVEEHPEHPPVGEPWNADDVIELHELLAGDGDDWFESFRAA
jgi:hypothetical protein